MSGWTGLELYTDAWGNQDGYEPARVRENSNLANSAWIEAYLTYSGTTSGAPLITEGSLPDGCFDTENFHTVMADCLTSDGEPSGACEFLIGTDGTVSTAYVPEGTAFVHVNAIYPTS